jgi:hypothetical protein
LIEDETYIPGPKHREAEDVQHKREPLPRPLCPGGNGIGISTKTLNYQQNLCIAENNIGLAKMFETGFSNIAINDVTKWSAVVMICPSDMRRL